MNGQRYPHTYSLNAVADLYSRQPLVTQINAHKELPGVQKTTLPPQDKLNELKFKRKAKVSGFEPRGSDSGVPNKKASRDPGLGPYGLSNYKKFDLGSSQGSWQKESPEELRRGTRKHGESYSPLKVISKKLQNQESPRDLSRNKRSNAPTYIKSLQNAYGRYSLQPKKHDAETSMEEEQGEITNSSDQALPPKIQMEVRDEVPVSFRSPGEHIQFDHPSMEGQKRKQIFRQTNRFKSIKQKDSPPEQQSTHTKSSAPLQIDLFNDMMMQYRRRTNLFDSQESLRAQIHRRAQMQSSGTHSSKPIVRKSLDGMDINSAMNSLPTYAHSKKDTETLPQLSKLQSSHNLRGSSQNVQIMSQESRRSDNANTSSQQNLPMVREEEQLSSMISHRCSNVLLESTQRFSLKNSQTQKRRNMAKQKETKEGMIPQVPTSHQSLLNQSLVNSQVLSSQVLQGGSGAGAAAAQSKETRKSSDTRDLQERIESLKAQDRERRKKMKEMARQQQSRNLELETLQNYMSDNVKNMETPKYGTISYQTSKHPSQHSSQQILSHGQHPKHSTRSSINIDLEHLNQSGEDSKFFGTSGGESTGQKLPQILLGEHISSAAIMASSVDPHGYFAALKQQSHFAQNANNTGQISQHTGPHAFERERLALMEKKNKKLASHRDISHKKQQRVSLTTSNSNQSLTTQLKVLTHNLKPSDSHIYEQMNFKVRPDQPLLLNYNGKIYNVQVKAIGEEMHPTIVSGIKGEQANPKPKAKGPFKRRLHDQKSLFKLDVRNPQGLQPSESTKTLIEPSSSVIHKHENSPLVGHPERNPSQKTGGESLAQKTQRFVAEQRRSRHNAPSHQPSFQTLELGREGNLFKQIAANRNSSQNEASVASSSKQESLFRNESLTQPSNNNNSLIKQNLIIHSQGKKFYFRNFTDYIQEQERLNHLNHKVQLLDFQTSQMATNILPSRGKQQLEFQLPQVTLDEEIKEQPPREGTEARKQVNDEQGGLVSDLETGGNELAPKLAARAQTDEEVKTNPVNHASKERPVRLKIELKAAAKAEIKTAEIKPHPNPSSRKAPILVVTQRPSICTREGKKRKPVFRMKKKESIKEQRVSNLSKWTLNSDKSV